MYWPVGIFRPTFFSILQMCDIGTQWISLQSHRYFLLPPLPSFLSVMKFAAIKCIQRNMEERRDPNSRSRCEKMYLQITPTAEAEPQLGGRKPLFNSRTNSEVKPNKKTQECVSAALCVLKGHFIFIGRQTKESKNFVCKYKKSPYAYLQP